MLRYLVRKLSASILSILGVSLIVFLILSLTPGDPAWLMLGEGATAVEIEALRETLGLNQPLYIQYFIFLKNALTGDLGRSYLTHQPVLSEIIAKMPATIELATTAMVVSTLFGILVGVTTAVRRGSKLDGFIRVITIVGSSFPLFWLGLLLILAFSVYLGWLPASGRGGLTHLILPAVTLGTYPIVTVVRLTRSSMLDVLGKAYIRTARSKGLPEIIVIYKHALKNALIPVVTFIGMNYGVTLAGTLLTETIFAWPGVGRLLMNALVTRDYPMIRGCVLVICLTFIAVNLAVDLLYAYINPKIRYD